MSLDNFEAPSLETLAALLPSYDFEAFIAKGGMGAVYKARQRRLDRDVAIKILPRELGEDAQFVASFETEAKAMAKLNHPNLISVFDYGEVDGMPYIVMEYVNGKSLFHSAQNLAVDPGQAVGIVKGICDGLAHAHENGVIHRDIKPANILLTPRAAPKIGDFGLARPVDSDGSGLVMGTPGYVAPEVLRHPEQADRRSDLFALGVVLYELLIGRCPPYDGYIPPSKLSGCDATLDRICEKAMNPVAEERYQTAEQMSADLEAWSRRPFSPLAQPYPAPLPNQSPLGPRRNAPLADPVHPAAAPRTVVRSSSSSSSGAVAGLVMLAIAIVVGAIGWSKFNSYRKAKAAEIKKAVEQVERAVAVEDPEKEVPTAVGKDDKPDKPARPGVQRAESPLKALARLKSRLRGGKRDEMPEGSVALGSSRFMVIPTAMGWPAASAFAEEHGAHLFVAKSDEDLDKLALLMPAAEGGAEAGLWIGGGSAGPDLWSWVDGSPWPESLKPEGEGPYLILDGKGGLQAREPGDRYPFAIQWREDGKNPAALDEMLKRTGESIAAGVPVYPPGTLQREEGRILVANGPSTYSQAAELAAAAGGELLSASTKELDDWLATKLPADGREGYWLGGSREEEAWAWANGDPWEYTRWSDESQASVAGGRLKVVPGHGWENSYSGDRASGFVVAWPSGPKRIAALETSQPADPPPVAEAPLPPTLVELEEKAKQLVANLGKDRDKELAANAKTFHWDLDTWLNDLSKNEVSAWRRDVNLLKETVRNNRVPARVSSDSGFRMSEQMRKVVGYCAEKQRAIDAAFNSKAGKIRDSYVTRMNAALAEATPDVAATIQRRVDAAADLDRWTASLGVPGAKAVVPEVELKVLSAIYGTGGKDADVTERVRELLIKERRAFRVSPGDLGADPNPGWNKGLTVKYMVNGTERSKSWGENSEVKPEDFIPAGSVIVESGGAQAIVGVWNWKGDNILTFRPDGTLHRRVEDKPGTWKLDSADDRGSHYTLSWDQGWIVTVTVAPDGKTLEGKNAHNETVRAKKIPAECLAGGDDPLIGVWRWGSVRAFYIFTGDGVAFTIMASGTWKLESESGGKRTYVVEWGGGTIDRFSIARGSDVFKGTNSTGAEISAKRELPES